MSQPILTIDNRHTTACGIPPALSNASAALYIGYFANRPLPWFLSDTPFNVGYAQGRQRRDALVRRRSRNAS